MVKIQLTEEAVAFPAIMRGHVAFGSAATATAEAGRPRGVVVLVVDQLRHGRNAEQGGAGQPLVLLEDEHLERPAGVGGRLVRRKLLRRGGHQWWHPQRVGVKLVGVAEAGGNLVVVEVRYLRCEEGLRVVANVAGELERLRRSDVVEDGVERRRSRPGELVRGRVQEERCLEAAGVAVGVDDGPQLAGADERHLPLDIRRVQGQAGALPPLQPRVPVVLDLIVRPPRQLHADAGRAPGNR
uniref:Uncharacterized protein n=1 Tax=Triticum urartu TaxID=4572 RepID=A0A8R7QRG3_TRIUA